VLVVGYVSCMKILSVVPLGIPEVKVVRFARFPDERGYFCETFQPADLGQHPELSRAAKQPILQCNEAFSRRGTLRGLHVQWSPNMGKWVRPLFGHLVDFALDLRLASPTFGRIVGYDMPARPDADFAEWIFVPPGFAHGTLLPQDSVIEYFCTASWNKDAEAGISPLSPDLDWSLCDAIPRTWYEEAIRAKPLLSPKDRSAPSLTEWKRDPRSSLVTG